MERPLPSQRPSSPLPTPPGSSHKTAKEKIDGESEKETPKQIHPQRAPKPKPIGKPKAKLAPKPQVPPPMAIRGRDSYGNVPGVGNTRYVPWQEGGNGGTIR